MKPYQMMEHVCQMINIIDQKIDIIENKFNRIEKKINELRDRIDSYDADNNILEEGSDSVRVARL